MLVPDTPVSMHVPTTGPRVQPVVRPTLSSTSPTSGNGTSSTMEKKRGSPLPNSIDPGEVVPNRAVR